MDEFEGRLCKPTQKERLLAYLAASPRGITQVEAQRKLAIGDCAARIRDLREDGFNIVSIPTKKKNRYGEMTHFVTYKLVV